MPYGAKTLNPQKQKLDWDKKAWKKCFSLKDKAYSAKVGGKYRMTNGIERVLNIE